MDKADFSFIVTSFCYLALSLVCRSGYLPMEALDVAGIVLWGVLLITTLIKSKFYMMHVAHSKAVIAIAIAIALFLLSIIIPNIYPLI